MATAYVCEAFCVADRATRKRIPEGVWLCYSYSGVQHNFYNLVIWIPGGNRL